MSVVCIERTSVKVDEISGFTTKTILCMPILSCGGEILGVVQLLNKMDNTPFNTNDENLFEVGMYTLPRFILNCVCI